MVTANEKIVLEWEAGEEKKDQNYWLWIILVIIASAIIIGYSFYKKEWLMGAVFIAAILATAWTLLAKTTPVKTTITTKGIWVGPSFYDFEKIKGYWFSPRKQIFFLEQKGRVGLTVSFPIGNMDIENIKKNLPEYLTEMKERETDWVDQLSKRIGF